MKKFLLLTLLLPSVLLSACSSSQSNPADAGPVEVYAVLAEKDNYQGVGMTNLLVDYINNTRLREALESQGWPSRNIFELREFTRVDLVWELDRLEDKADENDLVFFYVSGHGRYLSNIIDWGDFFPAEWAEIASTNKVLIVDACQAAKFTKQLKGGAGLVIATVDEGEYGWAGLEEEGLPIIGSVFTYYFTEALAGLAADSNGDGLVSVQEAALAAEAKQREYMHEVVFSVPMFLADYHNIGVYPEEDEGYPDVIITDDIGEELFLGVNGP